MMKLKVIGPNQTEITMGGKVLFFSYDTLVLVRNLDEGKCYISSEKYSNTTTKHTNAYIKKEGISEGKVNVLNQTLLETIAGNL